MTNAKHDANTRPTIIAASNLDGLDIVRLQANPVRHALIVNDAATGTDNGNNLGNAMVDQNSVAVLTALSSTGDGSIIEVYADPLSKQLLVNSN